MNEDQHMKLHTYEAVAEVAFNKPYADCTPEEKEIVKQMCDEAD